MMMMSDAQVRRHHVVWFVVAVAILAVAVALFAIALVEFYRVSYDPYRIAALLLTIVGTWFAWCVMWRRWLRLRRLKQ